MESLLSRKRRQRQGRAKRREKKVAGAKLFTPSWHKRRKVGSEAKSADRR